MTSADTNQTFATSGQNAGGKGLFTRLMMAVASAFAARDAFQQLARESDAALRARSATREGELTRIAQMF